MRELLTKINLITILIAASVVWLPVCLSKSPSKKVESRKVDPRHRYYRYRILIPAGQETFVKLCDRETGNEILKITERDIQGITSVNTGFSEYCYNVTDEQVKNRWEEARLQ